MRILKVGMLIIASIGVYIQAIDLQTNVICSDLKRSIDQAQPVEKIKVTFEKVITAEKLSSVDRQALATHVVTYAQEQKEVTENALAALGNKTYDASKLMWGCEGW